MDPQRNNLSKASSPYLRQHAANPVWWQEWGREALERARGENKPLFVSVGYATCHWCHVMAEESFEDAATADILNRYFVPIKVDREQRPDIDQYLMAFINAQGNAGGFGDGTKFPPHCTLLYMLYDLSSSGNDAVKRMIERTLESILRGGLHDHLQGGFFRYCVGREWTIPHFEKMLYDQAMLLWVFSLAYRVLGKENYRVAVDKILQCLGETFEEGGLYYSGHDADTDHQEGQTYLWSREELAEVLTSGELARFIAFFPLSAEGKVEGRYHLLRSGDGDLTGIEAKLLARRKERRQPSVDKKIITSWNCLAGIGLIHAHRYARAEGALEKAEAIARTLLKRHFIDGRLAHCSFDGQVQQQAFLQDAAGMLLLLTYLYEETGRFGDEMELFRRKAAMFRRDDGWVESFGDDFLPVPAAAFDHPVPSSIALAEFALLRADILQGRDFSVRPLRAPLASDFCNVAALMANGFFHIIETPQKAGWDDLPANSLQKRGPKALDCYRGACRAR